MMTMRPTFSIKLARALSPIGIVLMQIPMAAAEPEASFGSGDRPAWKVGYRWTYDSHNNFGAEDRWARVVTQALPDGTYRAANGRGKRSFGYDADLNTIDERGPNYTLKAIKFPLSVGASWTHRRKIEWNLSAGEEESTWKVRAYETITVPAGSFECYRIEGEAFRHWQNGAAMVQGYNRKRVTTTVWYCPAVKWFGKRISEDVAHTSLVTTKTEELRAFAVSE